MPKPAGPRLEGSEGHPSRLVDAHGRSIDTLRLSVTDRCNMRCRYCMPPEGPARADRAALLTYEESERLVRILTGLGVARVRITGGEPLVRRGLGRFLARLARLDPAPVRLITTNGTLLSEHLEMLRDVGIRRLNVSIDSLRRETYREITGRDDLPRVLEGLERAEAMGFGLKLNVVVLDGVNDGEIGDFVELTRTRPWSVRFIEAMPFDDARGAWAAGVAVEGERILEAVRARHRMVPTTSESSDVAASYRAPGFAGTVGVIFGRSRRFCGSCSRLRISAQGALRTCLYAAPTLDLREMLRGGAGDEGIAAAIVGAVRRRAPDGRAAEAERERTGLGSMACIGG